MKLSIFAGSTSQSINVFIQDSSSLTGAGLSGLVFSGVTAYYSFSGTNAGSVAITMATLAAVNSAYSSGGFKEIDATNMKGLYRFDIPDLALAAAKGRSVNIYMTATGAAPCVTEIELTAWNNQDAVRGGLSALPNTACTSNASLLTSGSGTDQLTVSGGIASADAKKINAVSAASVTTVNANIGSTQPINFTGTGASALVQTDVTDWKAAAAPAMTGDAFARLGAPAGASVSADIAAAPGKVWDVTLSGHLTSGTTGNALNAAGSAGDPWATAIPGSYGVGTAGNIVGNRIDAAISSRLASASIALSGGAVTVGTNNDKSGYSLTASYSFATGTSAMTESYAANGTAPTPVQAIYAIHQMLTDFAITGTSINVKQLDHTTTAYTVTLDSATSPTQALRS